ncbi:MAG: hypothetical protein Ta2A_10620 [Treponemataceae bacterium]|nr:MAG: hypothetical protein Ta2A_10620 [Treponemataceae bacterium]
MNELSVNIATGKSYEPYDKKGYIIEDWGDGNFEVEFSKKETGETIAILVLKASEMELI